MNLSFARPSALLAAVEDGVLGTGGLIRHCAVAVGHSVADKVRSARNEYKARTLASANLLADKINATEAEADRLEIAARTEELIAKRRKGIKRAARKAKGR